MPRLVEPEVPAARQRDVRQSSPAAVEDWIAFGAERAQPSDLRVDIVRHQEELVPVAGVAGMDGCLRRWKPENQPAVTSVDMRKSDHIAEEVPVECRIARIQHNMRAGDHPIPPLAGWPPHLWLAKP